MYKEDTVKYKILATLVAGSLLAACNSSDVNDAFTLQAFDPAVLNMQASYKCNDATVYSNAGKTNFNGNANITNAVVTATPERCAFRFVGGSDAVDTSNGKSMDGVTYLIPKGLAQAGQLVTASPLTTLIANALGEDEYDEAAASEILEKLGLGTLINNNGTSISDLLLKTETVANALSANDKATLLSTTAVLSDVAKNNTTASVQDIADATKKFAAAVVTANPNYPTTPSGNPAVVKVTQTVSAIAALNDTDLSAAVTIAVEEGEAEVNPDADTDTDTPTGTGTDVAAPTGGN